MIRILAILATTTAAVRGVPVNVCDNEEVKPFTAINNNFGFGLYQLLSENEGNLFFSPSSVTMTLGPIYAGSNGKTREDLIGIGYLLIPYGNMSSISPLLDHCLEIYTTLKSTSEDYILERANAILAQKDYPILQEYKDTVQWYFGALAEEVDFSGNTGVDEVNRWVREKTHGKISKLVDDLDESTRLLLLSAIYFKGTWQTEFDSENTKPRPFYNNGKDLSKSVPTMKMQTKLPFLYDSENQYRALELPYKGNDVSMVIILPFERDGFENLQKTFTYDMFADVLKRLRETEVTVSLPKFKIEYSKSLKDDLIKGGLGAMFKSDADFSLITGNKDLHVSDIIHKGMVEINEEGSEAASVTGGIMVQVSLEIPNPMNEFNADHPFLFYIVDNRSGSSMFIGRVSEL